MMNAVPEFPQGYRFPKTSSPSIFSVFSGFFAFFKASPGNKDFFSARFLEDRRDFHGRPAMIAVVTDVSTADRGRNKGAHATDRDLAPRDRAAVKDSGPRTGATRAFHSFEAFFSVSTASTI